MWPLKIQEVTPITRTYVWHFVPCGT